MFPKPMLRPLVELQVEVARLLQDAEVRPVGKETFERDQLDNEWRAQAQRIQHNSARFTLAIGEAKTPDNVTHLTTAIKDPCLYFVSACQLLGEQSCRPLRQEIVARTKRILQGLLTLIKAVITHKEGQKVLTAYGALEQHCNLTAIPMDDLLFVQRTLGKIATMCADSAVEIQEAISENVGVEEGEDGGGVGENGSDVEDDGDEDEDDDVDGVCRLSAEDEAIVRQCIRKMKGTAVIMKHAAQVLQDCRRKIRLFLKKPQQEAPVVQGESSESKGADTQPPTAPSYAVAETLEAQISKAFSQWVDDLEAAGEEVSQSMVHFADATNDPEEREPLVTAHEALIGKLNAFVTLFRPVAVGDAPSALLEDIFSSSTATALPEKLDRVKAIDLFAEGAA